MKRAYLTAWALTVFCFALSSRPAQASGTANEKIVKDLFQTSDRCFACHNTLSTPGGEDISIGLSWRPTIMANSARDPY